jgi:hypothetical protein
MTTEYAFEHCPLRNATHLLADRVAAVRAIARALWPASRRAERVVVDEHGIEAWSLSGRVRLRWDEISDVRSARVLFGRKTLRIAGGGRRIQVAPILPGFDELALVVAAHARAGGVQPISAAGTTVA